MSAVSRSRLRALSVVAGVAGIGAVLAGCGGGSSPTTTLSAEGASGGATTSSFQVVSGKVLAASATTATVQAASGPSTVAFSSSTRFTKTSAVTRSSLAKGDCVMVATAEPATRTATPSQPPSRVTARSVTVTSSTGCNVGARGQSPPGAQPQGGFARQFTGTPPTGGPGFSSGEQQPRPFATGSPGSGGNRRGFVRGRFGGGVFGTVTSIRASSFVVKPAFGQSGTTTVKTTSKTTYDEIASATASDVTTGACLSAAGTTDVSGVLDARTASISLSVKGQCPAASRFGGGPVFAQNGPGGPPGAGNA
ncbi:MAG TPA: hypothetical protein VHC43_03060 [Mycobacteriales bacterium]|nr:hypothetical protein [Mycobacteriales bacterium]